MSAISYRVYDVNRKAWASVGNWFRSLASTYRSLRSERYGDVIDSDRDRKWTCEFHLRRGAPNETARALRSRVAVIYSPRV